MKQHQRLLALAGMLASALTRAISSSSRCRPSGTMSPNSLAKPRMALASIVVLLDQERPGGVQRQHGLLRHALDRHERHLGPKAGDAQGRRIHGVVLLALLDEGLHRLGCDQLHLMTQTGEQTTPVMAGAAGLEEHGAAG